MTDDNRVETKEPLHCVRCGAEVVEKPLPAQGGGTVPGMSLFVCPQDCHDPAGTGLDSRDLPAGGVVNLAGFGLVGVDTMDTLKARSDQTRGMSMEERMRRSPELDGEASVLGALEANTARLARKYGEGPEAEALARGATDEEVADLEAGFTEIPRPKVPLKGKRPEWTPPGEKIVEAMRDAEGELLGEPPEELGDATDPVLAHDPPTQRDDREPITKQQIVDGIPETPDPETVERLRRAGVIPYVWLATAAALGGSAWAALRAFFTRGG